MTDWEQLLEKSPSNVRLRTASSDAAVRDAEVRLGHPLPAQLTGLLKRTDGFHDSDAHYDPCWPLARLVDENLRIRRRGLMPRADDKLCFGDNGAGEPFLFMAEDPDEWGDAVLVWSWIDEDARPLATNLAEFWKGWLDGSISS